MENIEVDEKQKYPGYYSQNYPERTFSPAIASRQAPLLKIESFGQLKFKSSQKSRDSNSREEEEFEQIPQSAAGREVHDHAAGVPTLSEGGYQQAPPIHPRQRLENDPSDAPPNRPRQRVRAESRALRRKEKGAFQQIPQRLIIRPKTDKKASKSGSELIVPTKRKAKGYSEH